jgi:curved DNA-binding protein CbpA
MEGYLFSRLDGVLTIEELCSTVGLEHDEVSRIVNKLADLGAVDVLEMNIDDDDAPSDQGEPAVEDAPPSMGTKKAADEEGEVLSLETRQLLNQLKLRAENSNYYQLLGVDPRTDKKDIRNAYFDLSKKLHPDSYFGKNLGKYRTLMEEVFAKLTEAYETLSRKNRREKYDEYIADQIQAWEMERRLSGEMPPSAPAAPPPRAPTPPPQPRAPSPPQRAPAPPPPPVSIGAESALHRRLRQERGKAALIKLLNLKPTAPEAKKDEIVVKSVADSITIPEPPRGASAEQVLAYRYAKAGLEAVEIKNLNTALNFLQLASQLAPFDGHIKEAEEKVRAKTNSALSNTYERQGRYEEEAGHYLQAAISFSKALELKGEDHLLMHRVALNLLRGDGDMKKARDLARNAVKLHPDSVIYRLTLAEIYLKKGWENDARRELDTAYQLDPHHERVVRLLRAIGRER